jgi:5'-nucleotidase
MQGYFRGLPALAVSAPPGSPRGLKVAARAAAALVKKMADNSAERIFLNINVPDLPWEEIRGARITRLARSSHINSVTEENSDKYKQYRLVRERVAESGSDGTDIQAIVQGYISITPMYTSLLDKPPQHLLKKLGADLALELKKV